MESFLKDPSLSPSKQVKSKRKTHHHQYQHQHQHQHQVAARLPNISRQSSCSSVMNQKFAPPPRVQLEMVQLAARAAGGVFLNHHYPQQISHSSSLPPLLPTYYQHHYHHYQPKMNQQPQQQQQQQPPLLPLPVVSKPITFRSLPPPSLTRSQSLASPIPKKQPNKTKATKNTATAAATKTAANIKKKTSENMKKENKELAVIDSSKETKKKLSEDAIDDDDDDDDDEDQVVWPAKGAGPDPGSLPKEFMTRVLLAADLNTKEVANPETEKSSTAASVFNLISPPPSSLPLPKFTMRQNKLSCNAEAAAVEVDTGATDNLCRLLKLR